LKWFKHDSTCHIDAKVKKLKQRHGIVGYGLYLYFIELVAMKVDKENITFELEDDAETIAYEWRLDVEQVEAVMAHLVELELFEIQPDGAITCFKLASRLDDTNSKNPEIKAISARLKDKQKLADITTTQDETRSDSEPVGLSPSSSDQTRLDKIRLDKNKNTTPSGGSKEYAFEGESFRVTPSDFKKHATLYPNLNLESEYLQLDTELRDKPKKQRWGALNAKLNYRNKQHCLQLSTSQQARQSNVSAATQQNASYAAQAAAECKAEANRGASLATPYA
jgi:hypothetical protein